MPTNTLQNYAKLSLNDKVKTFAQLKDKRNQLEKVKKDLDELYYGLRQEILRAMTEKKVLTLKTEDYTLIRSSRRTVAITNQDEAMRYFEAKGVPLPYKIDYYAALPTLNEALKQEQEIPGVEERPAEYVSVKLSKPTSSPD